MESWIILLDSDDQVLLEQFEQEVERAEAETEVEEAAAALADAIAKVEAKARAETEAEVEAEVETEVETEVEAEIAFEGFEMKKQQKLAAQRQSSFNLGSTVYELINSYVEQVDDHPQHQWTIKLQFLLLNHLIPVPPITRLYSFGDRRQAWSAHDITLLMCAALKYVHLVNWYDHFCQDRLFQSLVKHRSRASCYDKWKSLKRVIREIDLSPSTRANWMTRFHQWRRRSLMDGQCHLIS